MKHQIILVLFGLILNNVQAQHAIGENIFNHLSSKLLILNETGLVADKNEIELFVSDLEGSNEKSISYQKSYGIEVNPTLEFEIGVLESESQPFMVMFLKNKIKESSPKIDFLVIYKKIDNEDQTTAIDTERSIWMKLCNAHEAAKLVQDLYTPNACYYNRGRLIQGTKAISTEYGYMNSPGYSLTLTPKHLTFVTPEIAYEIGQCSGSYNLPYMLLWQKQSDGSWKILMDSNY